ncbi:MAG: MmcQ/YjbR family DNA-binding protein [Planctomycetota bacterium JB042]
MAAKKKPTRKTPARKRVAKKKETKTATRKRVAKKKTAASTTPPPKPSPGKPSKRVEALIRHALTYPEAWLDHPWGEHVVKVRKKVFVFFGVSEQFGMAVKLPVSGPAVLEEPFAEPTGYGLGKSGWVTIRREGLDRRKEQVEAWIEESYLAVAPKTLARRHLEGE